MNESDGSQGQGSREVKRLRRSGSFDELVEALGTVEKGSIEQPMLVDGFARLRDPRATGPVAGLLSEEPMTRTMAVATLSRMELPDTEPYLLQALDYPEPESRAHAAAGLGRLRSREAIPGLKRMLSSDIDFERITAARALASFHDPDANQAVQAARSRESFWTRRRYPKLQAE